jgi:hypothetical protein
VEALDGHPQVAARYEVMAPSISKGESPEQQLERARRAFTPPEVAPPWAAGFKTKLRDVLDREGFAALLDEFEARVILLTRRNVVKLNVSSFNSERLRERTGDWNLYRSGDEPEERLRIDPGEFAKRLDEYERELADLVDFVAELAHPALWLFYENLLDDVDGTLAAAFRFLGVGSVATRGRTLKSTSDDLAEALVNFDELRARYSGTRYEAMFDEGRPAEVR